MGTSFIKVTSPSGEQRWINLDRVTRVSLAVDGTGDAVMVFCFDGNDHVRIHGDTEQSRSLIHRIAGCLNELAGPDGGKLAA